MKQTLWNFEDFMESPVSDGINTSRRRSITSSDEVEVLEEDAWETLVPRLYGAFFPFKQKLEDMMEEYIYQVQNMTGHLKKKKKKKLLFSHHQQ